MKQLKKNKQLLDMIYKPQITNQKYITFGYQKEYQEMKNIDYGYVPFCTGMDFEELSEIIPLTNPNNRCGQMKKSTKYIVVHDTASGAPSADARAHRNWLMSMATNPESTYAVSWHFTVDDHTIYQHLPIDEVGYHAGDGTGVKLKFADTFVKANGELKVTISSDGFFVCNGIKTALKAPDTLDVKPEESLLPYQGINYKVGKNGNYYLGNTYYNKGYKTISNRGGNLNSVGIETCVNYGADYVKTMRITAYLVAKLLIHYHLPIDSVKQHNAFSGKDCPMTMRHAKRWEEFIKLVKLNVFFLMNFKDKKVEFISLSPEFLDKSGKVIKYEEGREIKYQINIDNEQYVFTSVLDKKSFED